MFPRSYKNPYAYKSSKFHFPKCILISGNLYHSTFWTTTHHSSYLDSSLATNPSSSRSSSSLLRLSKCRNRALSQLWSTSLDPSSLLLFFGEKSSIMPLILLQLMHVWSSMSHSKSALEFLCRLLQILNKMKASMEELGWILGIWGALVCVWVELEAQNLINGFSGSKWRGRERRR